MSLPQAHGRDAFHEINSERVGLLWRIKSYPSALYFNSDVLLGAHRFRVLGLLLEGKTAVIAEERGLAREVDLASVAHSTTL